MHNLLSLLQGSQDAFPYPGFALFECIGLGKLLIEINVWVRIFELTQGGHGSGLVASLQDSLTGRLHGHKGAAGEKKKQQSQGEQHCYKYVNATFIRKYLFMKNALYRFEQGIGSGLVYNTCSRKEPTPGPSLPPERQAARRGIRKAMDLSWYVMMWM
ncbi:MAG: hypothetical protein U5L00_01100 [Desulfovermiculus sp.]|nr:hypothetical protein [Desulfovermiculus sp.]